MKLKNLFERHVSQKIMSITILIIIYRIIFFYIIKNLLSFFCLNCINNQNNNLKCSKCSADVLFKSIKFKSNEETLKEIVDNKKSITRFGDGEFEIIFGNNLRFQKFNKTLKDKLLYILQQNNPGLMVGIIQLYNNKDPFWKDWLKINKFKLARIIKKHKIYYSSLITRFYSLYTSRLKMKQYVLYFKKIFINRNILIIEGDQTRLGIGNDLFNKAKSIKRILCPKENAFDVYEKILDYVRNMNLEKDTLILISLGPTATVLVYDLFKLGNQIIDFGHFDIQYEFYLRNLSKKKKIRISYKYVNEVAGGSSNITKVSDVNYYKQIICNIT